MEPTARPASSIDWSTLKRRRIVFGHQSVGHNVLSGVARLAARDGVRLSIQEQRTAPVWPGIGHFRIGRNGDPASKICDFAAALDNGAAHGVDVALMKLCYADFKSTTSAAQLADDYIASLKSMSRRHPGIRFAAITAPVTTLPSGPKAWLKRLTGKLSVEHCENSRRAEFNVRLRQQYGETDRLFDLARIESEGSEESRAVRTDSQMTEALRADLTSDGGHLNPYGQLLVATAFLKFVCALAGRQAAR